MVAASRAATTSRPVGCPLDLADNVLGDLLRCHELHEPEGGEGLELGKREEAVLAHVDVDACQRLIQALEPSASIGEGLGHREGARRVREWERAPTFRDGTEADGPPGYGSRRLDLLHGRGTGRPGHEVEEERVSTGQSRLREEHSRRSLLRVGEWNVEAHAPGAHGPHLHIDPGPRLPHPLEGDLHVPGELRQVQGQEVTLHGLAVHRSVIRLGTEPRSRGESVLVGQGTRRVHTVHDDIRAHPG